MPSPAHILACITPHGFGHAAQTTAVLHALQQQYGPFRLTLMSNAPQTILKQWLPMSFSQHPIQHDPGILMHNALDVHAEASLHAYQTIIQQWDTLIETLYQQIARIQPDLIIGNIPFHIPVAAKKLGIPCINLCSLNWADIFSHYCGHLQGSTTIIEHMRQAYATATHTITMAGGMPMQWLHNQTHTGPIARTGNNKKDVLKKHFSLNPTQRLILISMGGIRTTLPIAHWPVIQDTYWLVEHGERYAHPHALSMDALTMPFIDLISSCDAMIIKVGYGSMVEAARQRIPVLYIPRNDWPEEPYLINWFTNNGHGASLQREAFEQGLIEQPLNQLLKKHARMPPVMTGNQQAAEIIYPFIK